MANERVLNKHEAETEKDRSLVAPQPVISPFLIKREKNSERA